MQHFLMPFVFLLSVAAVFAAENDAQHDLIPPSHVIIEIPQEENIPDTVIHIIEDTEEHTQVKFKASNQAPLSADENEPDDITQGGYQIDTLEDVESAGCAIGCLQKARTGSTFAAGLFSFFGGLGNTAKTALITLSALGGYSSEHKRYLGITSAAVSAASLIANKISSASSALALANQKELQDIEDQIATVLAKYEEKQAPLLLKATQIKLSSQDQKTVTELQERYKNITSLNGCEVGCFSFLNSFFSCTSTFSQVMEFICNTTNLVMVPLATCTIWDPQTAQALDIAVIIIESTSVFFNQWSQQAQRLNQASASLKKELDKYN